MIDHSILPVACWISGGILRRSLGCGEAVGSTVTIQSSVVEWCHQGVALLSGACLCADSWEAG